MIVPAHFYCGDFAEACSYRGRAVTAACPLPHLTLEPSVQVAREMVMELKEVPEDAVLDISGAIISVARQARMKQISWQSCNIAASQHAALQHSSSSSKV